MYVSNVISATKGVSDLWISRNTNVVHHDQEVEWFEPIPTLEGDIVEITEETLKANIALVKKEVSAEEEEDDDDDELPDVPSI